MAFGIKKLGKITSTLKKGDLVEVAPGVIAKIDSVIQDSYTGYIIDVQSVASEFGRVGGKSRSEKKQAASRENGKRGGRPRKQEIDKDALVQLTKKDR